MTSAASGRPLDQITVAAARSGELELSDISISPQTLEHQAAIAEQRQNPQLAENLRRAAELVSLPDAQVLEIYEALRPGRSDASRLTAIEQDLRSRGARRCADLVAEARSAYARRGLL